MSPFLCALPTHVLLRSRSLLAALTARDLGAVAECLAESVEYESLALQERVQGRQVGACAASKNSGHYRDATCCVTTSCCLCLS
jgi:hypothetical protein